MISIVVAALMLASAYGGHVQPRESAVANLLTLALLHVAVFSLVVLVVMVVLRQWAAALIVGVAMLVSWPSLRLVCPVNVFKPHISENDSTFSIITFNSRVLGYYFGSRTGINPNMKYLIEKNPDVIIMQEGSLTGYSYEEMISVQPFMEEIKKKYPYRSHWHHDVMIMSRHPYKLLTDELKWANIEPNHDQISDRHDSYGKVYDVFVGDDTIRIIGVHLTSFQLSTKEKTITQISNNRADGNVSRMSEFKALVKKIQVMATARAAQAKEVRRVVERSPRNMIVCGDFNDTPASYTYRTIKGDDLNDAFAETGLGPISTYKEHGLYFKIDHVLYRGNFKAVSSVMDKIGTSDHYPQMVTFKMTKH